MDPILCLPVEINILIAEFAHNGPIIVRKDGYISFRRNLLFDEFSIGRMISDGCHTMKINNSIRMWSQDTIVGDGGDGGDGVVGDGVVGDGVDGDGVDDEMLATGVVRRRRTGVLLRMFTRIHVRDQIPGTHWDINRHGANNDYVRITYTMRHILIEKSDLDVGGLDRYVWKLQIQKQTMMGSFPAFMPVAQRRAFIHSNHAYETYNYHNIHTYMEHGGN